MNNPPFESDLTYSVQNEDYGSELALLSHIKPGRPLRVLMIASAGENALSLLTQESIASVDAIDLNPAQIHLCDLRRTAVVHLSRDEQMRLFGAHPAVARAGDEATRLALYDQLRPHLPADTRAFWDERRLREIAFGLQHVGRNDRMMHDLQVGLRAADFAPLKRPPRDEALPLWQAVYETLGTPAYMRALFRLPNADLAEKAARLMPVLAEAHFRALQQPAPQCNPYLTTVFADSYAVAAGEKGYPLYLQMTGQDALHRLGVADRLRLHIGNMVEQMPHLAAQHGLFDLISLSNIADWMTDAQLTAVLTCAKGVLAPGGAVLARTANPASPLPAVMQEQMQTDGALNATLPRVERGPWFRTVVAGFRL